MRVPLTALPGGGCFAITGPHTLESKVRNKCWIWVGSEAKITKKTIGKKGWVLALWILNKQYLAIGADVQFDKNQKLTAYWTEREYFWGDLRTWFRLKEEQGRDALFRFFKWVTSVVPESWTVSHTDWGNWSWCRFRYTSGKILLWICMWAW